MTASTLHNKTFKASSLGVLAINLAETKSRQWFLNQVDFCLEGRAPLKQCYDSYKQFLLKDRKKLPLSKKTFSIVVRDTFRLLLSWVRPAQ